MKHLLLFLFLSILNGLCDHKLISCEEIKSDQIPGQGQDLDRELIEFEQIKSSKNSAAYILELKKTIDALEIKKKGISRTITSNEGQQVDDQQISMIDAVNRSENVMLVEHEPEKFKPLISSPALVHPEPVFDQSLNPHSFQETPFCAYQAIEQVACENVAPTEVCSQVCMGSYPVRLSVGHTEAEGVGFDRGYTSLKLFCNSNMFFHHMTSFLDLRGHCFNAGHYAANAGLGLRWLCEETKNIFGLNAYYDYRQSKEHYYHQTGIGFEALGLSTYYFDFDFRVNGYFPVSHKVYNSQKVINTMHNETYLNIQQDLEWMLSGGDAEIGAMLFNCEGYQFYGAFGTYYLSYDHRDNAWGGKLRISTHITEYVSLDVIATHDEIFHDRVQATLAFHLPFECFSKRIAGKILNEQKTMGQSVNRREIIATDKAYSNYWIIVEEQ